MSEMKAKYDLKALYQLEHYLFKLVRFTASPEFYQELGTHTRDELLQELYQINHSIGTIRNFFDISKELKYVAWEAVTPYKGHQLVYTFSSIDAIKLSLGMDKDTFRNAHWNKRKNRKPHDGWYIMELLPYLATVCAEPEAFEPDYLINHIEDYGKKATKTDGAV